MRANPLERRRAGLEADYFAREDARRLDALRAAREAGAAGVTVSDPAAVSGRHNGSVPGQGSSATGHGSLEEGRG
jgi:hypothetical protein